MNNLKMGNDIINKFQQVDQCLDKCERVIGHWQPQNKFTNMYANLDQMCDVVEELTQDTSQMHMIGIKAKELNKDLEDIVRKL